MPQQAQQPLRPVPDPEFNRGQQSAPAPLPSNPNLRLPRLSPDDEHRDTAIRTKIFGVDLYQHLNIGEQKLDRRIIIGATFVSKDNPEEIRIPIILSMESVTPRTSAYKGLLDPMDRLTTEPSFDYKVTKPVTEQELANLKIPPQPGMKISIASDFKEEGNYFTFVSPRQLRGQGKEKLDMLLSQGGYIELSEGSIKLNDKENIKFSEGRLYRPFIIKVENKQDTR